VVAAVLAVPLFDSGLHILAVALLASLLPLLAWTVRAIAREEDRWPVIIAFAYLPAYAGWRFAAWLIGLFLESSKTWLRSPRHDPRATAERHLPEVAETRKFSSWVSKRRRDHP
jgi:hypothetical protein